MELLAIGCVLLFFLVVTVLPRTRLNKYIGNDGPLFGSFSDRVTWFSERQTDNVRAGKSVRKPLPPVNNEAYYWERDDWDFWRLWTSEDRKNLALVTTDFTWRIFTSHLVCGRGGYILVAKDDLLALGIRTFDTAAWTPTVMGKADSLETAKHQAEATIGFIRDKLGGEHIGKH